MEEKKCECKCHTEVGGEHHFRCCPNMNGWLSDEPDEPLGWKTWAFVIGFGLIMAAMVGVVGYILLFTKSYAQLHPTAQSV